MEEAGRGEKQEANQSHVLHCFPHYLWHIRVKTAQSRGPGWTLLHMTQK